MKKFLLTVALFTLSACGGPSDSASGNGPPLASDEEKGRRAFGDCGACHTARAGDPSRIGPNLFGVIGRPAGIVEDFAYSVALREADVVWDETTLDAFLTDPQGFLPGNRMALPGGVPDPERRAALIAYLKTLKPETN